MVCACGRKGPVATRWRGADSRRLAREATEFAPRRNLLAHKILAWWQAVKHAAGLVGPAWQHVAQARDGSLRPAADAASKNGLPRQRAKKKRSAPAWGGALRWETCAGSHTAHRRESFACPRTSSSHRDLDRLADRPKEPGLCIPEQTPLIRGTLWHPATQQESKDRQRALPSGMSSAGASRTLRLLLRVPFDLRKREDPALRVASRGSAVSERPGELGRRRRRFRGCGRALPSPSQRTGRCCGTRTVRSDRR